jgi:hypothetical protein
VHDCGAPLLLPAVPLPLLRPALPGEHMTLLQTLLPDSSWYWVVQNHAVAGCGRRALTHS